MKKLTTKELAIMGLMAALCFVGYAVFPAISVTGTKIHLGNAFVVLGALLLGGLYGGLAGAVGLSISDIVMGYVESAPRTFITKLVIGLMVGLVAYKIKHIREIHDKKKIFVLSIVASVVALLVNCVFEPALKYVWYTLLTPNAEKSASAIKALMAVTTYTTMINAIINAVAAVILFNALLPFLRRMGIWEKRN